jgi:uridine phosphorylase
VFTADGLVREARRQKGLPTVDVPRICLLDPDGDIADNVLANGLGGWSSSWACYHSRLLEATVGGRTIGVIPRAVGGSYAVLVAEQLFAAGCELLLSVTSAGQLAPLATPPYFVLVTRAVRDEGTSYHYLPAGVDAVLGDDLATGLRDLERAELSLHRGASWTTDAPFRETQTAIDRHTTDGVAAVEMEAASLYAFAAATGNPVVCFAHVTNQMARVDGDFEKGDHQGAVDALAVVKAAIDALTRSER